MEPGQPCDLDALAQRLSALGAARLLTHLAGLELRGLVRRAGSGRFLRLLTNVLSFWAKPGFSFEDSYLEAEPGFVRTGGKTASHR